MPERIVQALLAAVEELAPGACGAFVVTIDGRRVGSVFAEGNRVCWAATAGLSRRLRDLLRDFVANTVDGSERGVASSRAMRTALELHTIESLIALPEQQGEVIEWVTRSHSYRPRFTFNPAELLVAVNARLYAHEATGGDHALDVLELDTRGASFVIGDDGSTVPVRLAARYPTVAELVELGPWADAALGATRGFSHQVLRNAIALATSQRAQLALGWRTSRTLIHAAVFDNREALERTIATLESGRYPAVLCKRPTQEIPLAVRDGLGSVDGNV